MGLYWLLPEYRHRDKLLLVFESGKRVFINRYRLNVNTELIEHANVLKTETQWYQKYLKIVKFLNNISKLIFYSGMSPNFVKKVAVEA